MLGLHDIVPILRGIERHQRDARAAPRRGRSSFDAGMAAADDDDIERVHARAVSSLFHVEHSFSDAEFAEQARRASPRSPTSPVIRAKRDVGTAQRVGDDELVVRIDVGQRCDGVTAMCRLAAH